MVAFFTSYSYMQQIVREWDAMGVLKQVLHHKLVFIETTDVIETTMALENFKRACDCGRGARFLFNSNPDPDPDPDPDPNPNQVYYDAAGDVQKNVVSDLTYPPEIRRARGSEIN